MNPEPILIEGGLSVDDRGTVSYANNFSFEGVKRFYSVTNFATQTIRAWHGHLKEGKYVLVSKGSAIVAASKLDKGGKLSKKAAVARWILSSRKPAVLWIPPGYANGFRVLENDSVIIFFSTSTLEESKGDDFRFPADHLGENIWQVENR